MAQENLYYQVLVNDVEKGMTIAKDVLNSKGEILLAKGFKVITAATIRRLLSQHGITLVNILVEETQSSMQEPAHDKGKTGVALDGAGNEGLVRVIDEFGGNRKDIKESFNKFVQKGNIEKQEIEERINEILGIFKGNTNVFQIMQNVKHLDDVVYSHCHNVALISYTIGRWLGLDEKDLEELALGGMLADIGKTRVDEKLLNKKGMPTDNEIAELKEHSALGYEMIKDYDFISERVKKAVLFHHERNDGSGYPLGLKGDEIPLFARIIAIADVYNALVSDRPYRDRRTPFGAIRVLETEYMDKLDTGILYLFLRRIASNYTGQRILLNNSERGEIVFIPKYNIHRPVIRLQESGQVVDLNDSQYMSLDIAEFF